MRRYELTDDEWNRIVTLLPPENTGKPDRPSKENRTMLKAMILLARSGAHGVIFLTNAGKHAKLGELIGKAVIAAVKEALFLQPGLCPKHQHHVIKRMDRFWVTEDLLWEGCQCDSQGPFERARFSAKQHQLAAQGKRVAFTFPICPLAGPAGLGNDYGRGSV